MADNKLYSEGELLVRIAEGDEKAFEILYSKYYPRIVFFANRIVSDKETARDIVAETFIKCWKAKSSFESELHLERFLYVTTKNACLNALQRLKTRTQIEQKLYDELLSSENEHLLQRDLRSELLESVYREVEKLPSKYHQVFQLAFLHDLKNEEIVKQLGLSDKTVRTYKSEVLQLLRNSLKDKRLLLALVLLKSL